MLVGRWRLAWAILGAIVAMPVSPAFADIWWFEAPPMPPPRRVELAFGLDLRHLEPGVLEGQHAAAGTDLRAASALPEDRAATPNVVALFVHSTAEAVAGVFLGLDLEVGTAGAAASGDRDAVYWGAGAIVSAVPTRGFLVLRAELTAGVRGLALPAPSGSADRVQVTMHPALEPRLALELALDPRWSLGVHAGIEMLRSRTPVAGVYLRYHGRAAAPDLLYDSTPW